MQNSTQNEFYNSDEFSDFKPNLSHYHPPKYTRDPFWARCPPFFAWNSPSEAELKAHKKEFIQVQKEDFIRGFFEERRGYEEQSPFSRQSQPALLEVKLSSFAPPRMVKSTELAPALRSDKPANLRRFSV